MEQGDPAAGATKELMYVDKQISRGNSKKRMNGGGGLMPPVSAAGQKDKEEKGS